MYTTLTVRDETTFSPAANDYVFTLGLPTERITVRDLIRARVYQEVEEYNTRRPEYFHGLVQPADAQPTRDGYRFPKNRRIDAEKQFEKAIESFQGNGFILLVDDRQVEGLDETILISPETTVTFLKLVPLVGG